MNDKLLKHLENRLADAESRLRALLERVLPRTAESGEPIFFNSSNLPQGYPSRIVAIEAEELYSLATECVEVREALGQPLVGSVGQLYLSACREAASVQNEHRRGPRQLSRWLLGEVRQA
jgi:hypothetical protein